MASDFAKADHHDPCLRTQSEPNTSCKPPRIGSSYSLLPTSLRSLRSLCNRRSLRSLCNRRSLRSLCSRRSLRSLCSRRSLRSPCSPHTLRRLCRSRRSL
jgi:hypothetical protein